MILAISMTIISVRIHLDKDMW